MIEFLTFITGWIGMLFSHLTTQRLGQLLALGVIVSMGVAIWKIHTNKNNSVDLSELFLDRTTGKIEGSKLRMNLAFFVTSWVVVYVTLNGAMSEWLFAGYLAAWITDRKFSRDATITQDIK